jgi:DNA mismatch repair protein MutS
VDALAAFAEVASRRGYVRPLVDDSLVLEVVEGRHPVLEATMDSGRYVPNDLSLDAASSQILIVTGPNMAGKSTFIRQAALLVAMAQAGSFVPARSLRLGFVDKIFARVGASDDIARGRSTFMVEMVETARVLRTATERSLVVLDEVGRGTSTYDGVSIAWAVTEHLHEAPGLGCRTLFATHYHELCAISGELPRVKNVSVAVREWGDEITFLYRIVKGGADRSYGIHVARLAGVPAAVIERAREILTLLESRGQTPADKPIKGRKRAKVEQLALFLPDGPLPGEPSKVEEALKEVRIENLTPLQALVTLEELKRLLEP